MVFLARICNIYIYICVCVCVCVLAPELFLVFSIPACDIIASSLSLRYCEFRKKVNQWWWLSSWNVYDKQQQQQQRKSADDDK
jgi:hypothetical protein